MKDLKLVTKEIGLELKELGWIWDTPRILQIRNNLIIEHTRHIDCTVGSDFVALPAIQQVIEWLDFWGIKLTYNIYNCPGDGIIYYTKGRVYDGTRGEILPFDNRKKNTWKSWDEMVLDLLPEALLVLSEDIKMGKVEDKVEEAVKENIIRKTKFYNEDE